MGETELRRLQLALLAMLGELDRICRGHGIAYTLFAGTALGAARHEGFIPWDDDLDVAMLRADYERFLRLAPAELGDRYTLQAEYSDHWPMFFSKLRQNDTACMERFHPRDPQQHQGIFLDIFPIDNLYDFPPLRPLQFLAAKVVIAKALYARGYLTKNPVKIAFLQFCRLLPATPFRDFALNRTQEDSAMVHAFFGGSSRYTRSVFPRAWFTEIGFLVFEGERYPVSAHCDELLTTLYGDYRRYSPEKERQRKVHGVLVDLERSFEHYLDWQKNQPFPAHSRSIR